MATVTEKRSVYHVVTDRILEKLRDGVVPWHKPWSAGFPTSLASKKRYRGVNCFLLSCLDFEQPWFVTYKQARTLGGSVRKGQHGFPVVFWTEWERENADGTTDRLPVLRYYTVFNVEQCDNVPFDPFVKTYDHDPIAEADALLAATSVRPKILHGQAQASYSAVADRIEMPSPDCESDLYVPACLRPVEEAMYRI